MPARDTSAAKRDEAEAPRLERVVGFASPELARLVRAEAEQLDRSVSWVVIDALEARYQSADTEGKK